MKQTLQELLHFTRKERRSVLYLIIILLFIFSLPKLMSFFIAGKEHDYTAFEDDIEAWEEGLLVQDSLRKSKYAYKKKNYKKSNKNYKENILITPFPFNPNEASKNQFLDLGLPERTVKIILNFRDKGGKFYKNEDLKKIYGLKEEWYEKLEPYIRIKKIPFESSKKKNTYKDFSKDEKEKPSENKAPIAEAIPKSYDAANDIIEADTPKEKPATKKPKKKNYKAVIIDVNNSTTDDFQKVYGIGPSYAKRIVKYREQLGGFHSIEQISEVYGMPDSTYQKIKPSFKLEESSSLKKMNINTASTDDLKKHPYLKWKTANAIVKYRATHGDYKSVLDLKKNYAISEELYNKLSPYLSVK